MSSLRAFIPIISNCLPCSFDSPNTPTKTCARNHLSLMAYNYYPTAGQGWGTSQYELRTPPQPSVRPDPSWTGWDYYRSYGANPSRSLFSSIFERVRRSPLTGSLSSREARSLHRRIYSGMMNLGQVMPSELGTAAAYEAYRTWKYHSSLFQPLGVRSETTKEGLIGHAMAEASRLWQSTGRGNDSYGQRHALEDTLEAAAATAARLYYKRLEESREDMEARAMDSYGGGLPTAGGHSMASMNPDYSYRRSRRMSVPSLVRDPYSDTGYPSGLPPSPPVSHAELGLSGSYRTGRTPPSTYSTPYNSLRGLGPESSRRSMYEGQGLGNGISGSYPTNGGFPGSYHNNGLPGSYGGTPLLDQPVLPPIQPGMGMQNSMMDNQPGRYAYNTQNGAYGSSGYATGGFAPGLSNPMPSNQATYGGSTMPSTYGGGYPGTAPMDPSQSLMMDSGRRSRHRDGRHRYRSHSVEPGVGMYNAGVSSFPSSSRHY